jgi:hypothetical protein
MVVALFALAVAMIVGGLTAVVQGYEIVLLERGWTLVISGSVFASGGALLLGLATAVGRLGKIQRELVTARDKAAEVEHALPSAPELDPLTAASSGLLAGGAAGRPPEASHTPDADEPKLPLFMRRDQHEEPPQADAAPGAIEAPPEPADLPGAPARNDNQGPRLKLPRYLFGRRDPEPDEPDEQDADRDLPEPTRVSDEPQFRPSAETRDFDRGSDDRDRMGADREPDLARNPVFPAADADEPRIEDAPARTFPPVREPEAEPQSAAEQEIPPPSPADPGAEPPTIIGSYNSGDNRYVMFSDGSIEADTPDGVFRFASLDELKEFIASGGEGGARKAT